MCVCVNIGIDESPHKHVLPVSCKMASSASTSTMEDDRGEVSRVRSLFSFFFPSVSGDDDDDDDEHRHSYDPHLSCSRLPSSLQLQASPFPSLALPYPQPRPFLQFPLPSLPSPNHLLMTLFSLPFLSPRSFPRSTFSSYSPPLPQNISALYSAPSGFARPSLCRVELYVRGFRKLYEAGAPSAFRDSCVELGPLRSLTTSFVMQSLGCISWIWLGCISWICDCALRKFHLLRPCQSSFCFADLHLRA